MEIRLLKSGYKNNEQFYKDFLEERAKLIYNAINTKIFVNGK